MEIQRKKRRAIRSQVTRIVKEIDECLAASAEPTVDALKAMLQRLETTSLKLSEVDAAIERCLTDEDADEEFEQVLEYSDKIANSLGRLKHKIETQRLPRQAQAPSTSSNEPQPQKPSAPKAKLPKLELIRFDGKRKNWQPFWEQFEQSVHKNEDLTASDRFHYLRSLLTGDAAAAIAGLPATAQCYSDAVDLLQQRFGSPAALIQEHMQGLIDAQPLTSSKNVPALRRLYDRLQVHMRGLKSLGVADESYSAMLYPVLLRVLPADMILDYHRRQAEDSDGTSSAASANGDSASTGSSASSQGSPLRSLLHFYRRELESRERAAESRPDDNHVRAKTLFQEIWKANIAWDDPLPDHLLNEWTKWCQELPLLSEMSIPRTYEGNIGGNPVHRTLHVFCDASQKAYGAAAYLCTESSTGERTCTLIMAKCRVAPVKPITLARLELMGALMASRLCQFIGSSLKLHIDSIHLWTDSMITLHWIRGDAARWKEFVKNRVAEIQQNTDVAQWRHCPGKGNPADLMTRGMTAASLKSSDMWWHGPSWIRHQEEVWPSEERPSGFTPEELETKKEVNVATTTCEEQPDLLKLTRFSSATKVNRVTGWVMRFLHNLRSKEKTSGPLTAAEIERAEEYWLKKAQQTAFSDEIRRTTQRMKLSNDSSLKDFNLFTDEKGLLRIRGRLCSANKTRDERHPIVMPKEHRYTVLLVNRAHLQLLHAGARDTLVQLRERYWIVRGRQLVKSVVRSCAVCRRYSASHIEADTGLLPPERTTKAEPFEVVGIDFAGPLFVNEKDKMVKVYIVLFTCAVTRAVHLELVTDMSTGTFIQAFRRFVSRRGLCRVVYSDNALTFKRASKDMGNLWKALRHPDSQSYFSNSGIEWKFIAERAPWWGGFYERMVRSVKLALKKTIGRQTLGFVELSTVLAEVEAVINSRPLTYTYDDPNDGAPLTPACFLAGRRLTTLPLHEEKFVESSATSLRLLWQKRKQILHLFWNVWRKEYLGQLRSAYASKKTKGGVPGVGDVVLIREDRPRLLWKTGIVTAVFPGRDGKIRSCEVHSWQQ
ncbi:uncharacterized protein LOC144175312 [Haemaphysalis longicornis]